MNTFSRLAATSLAAGILFAGSAQAQNANNPPPSGQAIFTLDGRPLPQSYTTYTANFVATAATTNLSFAFREDPAYFSIDNITMRLGTGSNLVVNGDFEAGPVGGSTPAGWSYLNLYNAPASGIVRASCGVGGSNCYYDGAVGSYDSITQAIATTIGSLYTVSFALTDNSGQTTGSSIAVGNQAGINLVVYAGALPVAAAVPEPATWALMVLGFGAAGYGMRRRQKVGVSYAA